MPKALFTKVVTNTYQYEIDIDNLDDSYNNRYEQDVVDSFQPEHLVDVHWYIDVEEAL